MSSEHTAHVAMASIFEVALYKYLSVGTKIDQMPLLKEAGFLGFGFMGRSSPGRKQLNIAPFA